MSHARKDDGRVDIRCSRCNRLLARATPSAVSPGKDSEIKCKDCNELNYVQGHEAA